MEGERESSCPFGRSRVSFKKKALLHTFDSCVQVSVGSEKNSTRPSSCLFHLRTSKRRTRCPKAYVSAFTSAQPHQHANYTSRPAWARVNNSISSIVVALRSFSSMPMPMPINLDDWNVSSGLSLSSWTCFRFRYHRTNGPETDGRARH